MKLRILLIVLPLLVLGSSLGIFLIEGSPDSPYGSLFNSLWWTVVTFTTVGYGDMVPVTVDGKLFGILILCLGVLINSIIISFVSSWFFNLQTSKQRGLKSLSLKDHIVICSDSPVFIYSVLSENIKFIEEHRAVIITPLTKHPLLGSKFEKVPWLQGDSYRLDILKKASASEALIGYVSFEDDADTVMTVMQLEVYSPEGRIKTMARYQRQDYLSHLQNVGCDYAIKTFDVYIPLMVKACLSQGVPVWVREIILRLTSNSTIRSLPLAKHHAHLKWLEYLEMAKSIKGEMPLGYMDGNGNLTVNPSPEHAMQPDYKIISIVPLVKGTLGDTPSNAINILGFAKIPEKGHIVICSDEPYFIKRLLLEIELANMREEIIVLSKTKPLARIEKMPHVRWVAASSFSDNGLSQTKPEQAKIAFIDHERDSHTLMAVLRLETITGGDVFTVASYREPGFDERLIGVGCDYCINVDELIAPILSQNAVYSGVGPLIEQIISYHPNTESLLLKMVNEKWEEKLWLDAVLEFNRKYRILLVGLIQGENQKMVVNPCPDLIIKPRDRLMFIALTDSCVDLPFFEPTFI